jgi:hypothetical protein
VLREHFFQHRFQSAHVGSHDPPQNGVIQPIVFMADSVSDGPDLAPWLGRVVCKPVVGNPPNGLRDRLDCIGGGASRNRVGSERVSVIRALISCRIAISVRQSRIAMIGSFDIKGPE